MHGRGLGPNSSVLAILHAPLLSLTYPHGSLICPKKQDQAQLSTSTLQSCSALQMGTREGIPEGYVQNCKCCLSLVVFCHLLLESLETFISCHGEQVNGRTGLLFPTSQGQRSGQQRALGAGYLPSAPLILDQRLGSHCLPMSVMSLKLQRRITPQERTSGRLSVPQCWAIPTGRKATLCQVQRLGSRLYHPEGMQALVHPPGAGSLSLSII